MKKTFLVSLFGALVMGLQAADYQYLVFTTSSGQQAVAATDLTITFSGGNLTAASGATTLATIPLSDLSSMAFSDTPATGISSLETGSFNLSEATEVYDLSGRRLPSAAQLPTGVYVVKVNGRMIKVAVK